MEDDLKKKKKKENDLNQNYPIGCDTIENSD